MIELLTAEMIGWSEAMDRRRTVRFSDLFGRVTAGAKWKNPGERLPRTGGRSYPV